MPAKENEQKILIGPDDGARLPVLGITHKVTAEGLGGALTSIEGRIPPGDMIPPHTHTREDECAFVLEGELTFDVGGRIVAAPAGSFVLKPRGDTTPSATRARRSPASWSSIRRGSSRTTTTSTSG